MFNTFSSQLEVLTIYSERAVVEKQNRYAFYHQSLEFAPLLAPDLGLCLSMEIGILTFPSTNIIPINGEMSVFCVVL
jgi:ATP-binding cassette, subfamily G (WHITE), member 2, PDR